LSTSNDIEELLRKGIEASREERRNEARGYFERVVELDEKSEKGWFWLASVVESDEERRICLSNVLHINPNNERAKRALDALQAKAKERNATVDADEVVAGVSRRQLTLILGVGAVAVIVILVIALTVIVGNNNREAADRATAVAAAQQATDSAQTLVAAAEQATSDAAALVATQQALITPVAPTRAVATLPPTWTPTPMATLAATRESLPQPVDLKGRLAVWGGQDMLSVGYLPLGYYDLEFGNQYTRVGTALGKNISFALNGQRVLYTVYDQLLFGPSLEAVNLNGTQRESVPDRWLGKSVFQPDMAHYGGPFKQYIVFVALTASRQTTQVFLLNLNPPQGQDPLRQLTDDESVYTDPALSPDGTKVIVVRSNLNTANPTVDLVNIDVSTKAQIPVTNDGASYVESAPYYTNNGGQVLFAAVPSNQPGNNDLYLRTANGSGSSVLVYESPADDIRPVLSPDGRYLAFASNAVGDGRYDIYIFDRSAETVA
jgi:Tol biopolymer transport system component